MSGENHRRRRASDAYRKASSGEHRRSQASADERGTFEKVGPTPNVSGRSDGAVPHRAVRVPAQTRTDNEDEPSGTQRIARLMIALGPERAAEVIGRLDAAEVEQVAQMIVRTPSVERTDAASILQEIGRPVSDRRLAGGPAVAREILVRAFGEDDGERYFQAAVPETAPVHFEFLNDLEPHQIGALFREESAGAIAVVVPHLRPELASSLLTALPADRRIQVVRRVARMGRLDRETVVRIEEAVREKIRLQGRQVTRSVDGSEKLAAILRHLAPSAEGEILKTLEQEDPDLTRVIRERLYTTDLLLMLSHRHLSDLLRDFTDAEVALFLKGKSEDLRAHVLRAVSERRRASITEELTYLGPQKRGEVDRITHDVLGRLRELEEAGTILVPREGDRYI